MLQETATEPVVLWYRYGDGRDFRKSGDAIRHLQNEVQKAGMELNARKIVINDVCQSVSLAF